MIRLHRDLRDHPDAVEAHLWQYQHRDLRDLWASPPRLTMRQVAVMTRWVPDDSPLAIARAGYRPLTRTEQIADDIRVATLAGVGVKPEHRRYHPDHPAQRARHAIDARLQEALERVKTLAASHRAKHGR